MGRPMPATVVFKVPRGTMRSLRLWVVDSTTAHISLCSVAVRKFLAAGIPWERTPLQRNQRFDRPKSASCTLMSSSLVSNFQPLKNAHICTLGVGALESVSL
jgi:hypothetical protein